MAKKLRCSLGMVGKWRSRFLKTRLEGLYDEPRPGAPRKVTDDDVEQIIIQTLETTPRGQTHWSTRELAKATGFSRMTISRVWRAFGLKPHMVETFKISTDPLFVEKVRDVVPCRFVVMGATFQLSRTHWQHGLRTVQRLNLTLFINAKNHSVLRWIHVQTHDVAYFLNELWIR